MEVSSAPAGAVRRSTWRALLAATRPRQWIKNLLVFAVPAAAGMLAEPRVLADTALALVAFCLASAATYLFNDLADVESDRLHPVKRERPIARGDLAPRTAMAAAIVAVVLACAVAAAADLGLLAVVVAYIALTSLYTHSLKHVPVFDIATVASGFFLRAVAGGVAADIFISKWFLILAGGGSLFVVTAKRYAELRADAGARAVLVEYSEDYLRALLSTIAGVIVVAYCIWAFEDRGDLTAASAILFVLGVMRYGLLVDQGHGEEPEALVLGDRTLLGLAVACVALLVLGAAL